MSQQLLKELQSETQLQVHDPLVQDLRGSIKLEESQHWQHGENRAKKEGQIWQHAEINRAKKKERKTQGNYTCQREKKKQVEASDVWKEEETSKKKNQIEGTDVTL